MCVTGYIPYSQSHTIYLKDIKVDGANLGYIAIYNQNKVFISVYAITENFSENENGVLSMALSNSSTHYIRLCASVINENSILTLDEEIIGEPSNGSDNLVTEEVPYTVTRGLKIDSSTGAETEGTTSYSASSYIEIKNEATYTLTRISDNNSKGCKVVYYDTNKNFISCSSDIIAQDTNVEEVTEDIPLIDDASYFRLRLYNLGSTDYVFIVNETSVATAVAKWTNTCMPFVAGDYDEAIADLNYDVNNLKGFASSHENRLKKLENEGVSSTSDDIPNYVKTEADEVLDRVLEAQSTRTFNMAVVTDLHNNGGVSDVQILHASQGIGYIADRFKIDTFVSLGDHTDNFASSSWTDGQADMEAINSHHHKYIKNVDELRLIGNHDFKESRSPKIHKLISAFSKNVVWGDMLGCYFYKDYEDYKLRIICLNTSDEAYIGMSNAQYNWFVQSLDLSSKSNASEWQILIMSHVPLDWSGFTVPVYILQAYLNGTTWTDGIISCDFTNKNKAKIIATVHGHIHNFLVDKLHVGSPTATEQVDIYRIAMPEVTESYHNHYETPYKCDTSYPKVSGTAEDTSFSVLCIDLDNHIIKAICYGAGIDREISYYIE